MQGELEDIDAHRELVERVVRRLVAELELSCDLDDLRGYGFQGLYEAKQRFDPDRGVRFSTFAYYRIRGAVVDGIRSQGWMRRRAYAKLKAFEAMDALSEQVAEAQGASTPTSLAERAQRLDETLAKVSAAYMLAAVGQDKQEDDTTPESLFTDAQNVVVVREALSALPDKEQTLLRSIYFDGLTIDQAGQQLGLSKSWASRLHGKALERLRDTFPR
jgi:RNA polymerase sigma factor for flagellar operon FliA